MTPCRDPVIKDCAHQKHIQNTEANLPLVVTFTLFSFMWPSNFCFNVFLKQNNLCYCIVWKSSLVLLWWNSKKSSSLAMGHGCIHRVLIFSLFTVFDLWLRSSALDLVRRLGLRVYSSQQGHHRSHFRLKLKHRQYQACGAMFSWAYCEYAIAIYTQFNIPAYIIVNLCVLINI